MKHLYRVKLDVKMGHEGKRSWWDSPIEFNVIANGDAMKAVKKAKRLALRHVVDLAEEPVVWHGIDSRLVEVTRECEVHAP